MNPGIALVVVAFALLMFLAPIGIWNRLIKINGEQKRHNKAVEDGIRQIRTLLENLTAAQE